MHLTNLIKKKHTEKFTNIGGINVTKICLLYNTISYFGI